MTNKNRVDVIIDSRNFTIVGTEEEEYIQSIAYYVDKKIRELSSKNSRLSQTMTATLAALHIADELYKSNKELMNLEEKAKNPLEKYDLVCEELEKTKEKVMELKKSCNEHENIILSLNKEKESLINELNQNKEALQLKEKELEEAKKEVKELKDKNFQNQIELIEVKKELAEYIKILDRETSI